jgi:hypothetical protein
MYKLWKEIYMSNLYDLVDPLLSWIFLIQDLDYMLLNLTIVQILFEPLVINMIYDFCPKL